MKFKFLLLFAIISLEILAQNREHAFDINKRLARGINYGNMFESPAENEWGNVWKPQYAKMIAGLGFSHVRIPIRWEPAARSSATAPYTINPTFLARIKQVVDSALNNNLHAIINMHHHEALYENPDNQKARFLAQWKQISTYFKDYPDSLLFEIMNEPHGNLTPEKWNIFFVDAIATIREDNPTRVILIGTAEYGGLAGLSKLQIPDDENIILTVHYYNPFQFTHQGAEWVGNSTDANAWLGTKWNDSETERMVVEQDFTTLKAFSKTHKLPVHIGEFGAYNKADIVSRKKWTTFLARYFETLDWSWAYWEFSAGFGIYDPGKNKYNQELVDALLRNEMPEPAKYVGTSVYKSNFQNNNDGWTLTTHEGSASLSRADNSIKVAISSGGTAGWHIQLMRNNFKLTEGKKYRISFKAKAETTRSGTAYMGMNKAPWSAHSGYFGMSLTDTFAVYTYVFDMKTTDNSARIVFDIGNSTSGFTITDILLEEVVLQWPTTINDFNNYKTIIYPIPASNKLFINNLDNFQEYSLLNMEGKTLDKKYLNGGYNQVDISNYDSGFYFIALTGANKRFVSKIVKEFGY
jgi:aryl-phospho-beta-D-glucosidase BglC (GH1 family)